MDVRKVIKRIYTHRPTRWALIVVLILTIYLILLGNRISFVHVMVVDADGAPVANARIQYNIEVGLAPVYVRYAAYYLSGERFDLGFDVTLNQVTDSSGKFTSVVLGNQIRFEKVEHPDYLSVNSGGKGVPAWLDGMYDFEKATFQDEYVISGTAAQPIAMSMVVREKLGDWSRQAAPASPAVVAALSVQDKSLLAEIDPIAWDEVHATMPRDQLRERWSAVLSRLSASTLSRLAQATDRPATRWALLEIARRSQIRGLEPVAMAAFSDNIESELAGWRYLAWWGDANQFHPAIAKTKARDRQGLTTAYYAAAYLARAVKPGVTPPFGITLGRSFPVFEEKTDGGKTIFLFDKLCKNMDSNPSRVLQEILEQSSNDGLDGSIGYQVFLVVQSADPRYSAPELLRNIPIVEGSRGFIRDKRKMTSRYVWDVIAMHGGPVPDEIALKLSICGLRLANEPTTTAPATP
jgi:hypothetical protein